MDAASTAPSHPFLCSAREMAGHPQFSFSADAQDTDSSVRLLSYQTVMACVSDMDISQIYPQMQADPGSLMHSLAAWDPERHLRISKWRSGKIIQRRWFGTTPEPFSPWLICTSPLSLCRFRHVHKVGRIQREVLHALQRQWQLRCWRILRAMLSLLANALRHCEMFLWWLALVASGLRTLSVSPHASSPDSLGHLLLECSVF